MLITLEEAKEYLKVEYEDEDTPDSNADRFFRNTV